MLPGYSPHYIPSHPSYMCKWEFNQVCFIILKYRKNHYLYLTSSVFPNSFISKQSILKTFLACQSLLHCSVFTHHHDLPVKLSTLYFVYSFMLSWKEKDICQRVNSTILLLGHSYINPQIY